MRRISLLRCLCVAFGRRQLVPLATHVKAAIWLYSLSNIRSLLAIGPCMMICTYDSSCGGLAINVAIETSSVVMAGSWGVLPLEKLAINNSTAIVSGVPRISG